MSATPRTDERPVGELFQQLSTQTTTLVRQEIKLPGGALVAAAVLVLATTGE